MRHCGIVSVGLVLQDSIVTSAGRQQPPARPKGKALVLAHVLAKAVDTFNMQADGTNLDTLLALEYLRWVMTEAMVRGIDRDRRLSDGPWFKD